MSHVSIHLFLFSAWIIVWASPYLIEIDLSPSFLLENVGGEKRSIQIPESTIYRKALLITKKHLEKYMQSDVFVARNYYNLHNG